MKITFGLLALLALQLALVSGCPVDTTEVPTTTSTPTTTTTTTPSTTTTTESIGSGTVAMCPNGYLPDACDKECRCPVITFNTTWIHANYPEFVASDGNKTYVEPTIEWFRCNPGDRLGGGVVCPKGYAPLTVFFDKNKHAVATFEEFLTQDKFGMSCDYTTNQFVFTSSAAPNATRAFYSCYQ